MSGYNDRVKSALRDFRREDFDLLWEIDQKCFAPGIAYSRRELAAYIHRRGSFTIVAETTDSDSEPSGVSGGPRKAIVGFIVAEANRRAAGHILTIDVLPAARRFGVGSRLLTTAEDRLRAARCHTVVLETAVDNASALAFYKRHRYGVVKVTPRYYGNGVDALVLEKDLERAEAARQNR